MLSYVANHSKPLNYKSDQNTMTCTETMLNYESDQIGRQNEQKCWVTSQNILNNAKLQKWSNYDEL